MSVIAGFCCLENAERGEWLARMVRALRLRGGKGPFLAVDLLERGSPIPRISGDGGGIEGHLLLAHPFFAPGDRYWAILDGKIENAPELRKTLDRHWSFRTLSDAETLIAAYDLWKRDCTARLEGSWSFVLVDIERKRLWGARDRFGVVPLYYYKDARYLVFASSVAGVAAFGGYSPEIRDDAALSYLARGEIPEDGETLFRGIYALPPAHTFEMNLQTGAFHMERYYTLPWSDNEECWDEKRACGHIERTRSLLEAALSKCMNPDPPAFSLSGGIDSSSLVSLARGLYPSLPLKTFTVAFEGESVDEGRWARIAADHVGAEPASITPCAQELAEDLEDLVRTQELPFGSAGMYAGYRLMRRASEMGVTALVNGQGGDELFGGYNSYFEVFYRQLLRRTDRSEYMREIGFADNSSLGRKRIERRLRTAGWLEKLPSALTGFAHRHFSRRRKYLWKRDWNRLSPVPSVGATSLNAFMYGKFTSGALWDLMRYEDRNAARFGIALRMPLVENRALVESVFQIPSIYKIHNGWSKFLLRESLKDLLPESIRFRRDKIGFAVPQQKWLSEIAPALKPYFVPELERFFNVKSFVRDWQELFSPSGGSVSLWRFVNFAVWYTLFFGKKQTW